MALQGFRPVSSLHDDGRRPSSWTMTNMDRRGLGRKMDVLAWFELRPEDLFGGTEENLSGHCSSVDALLEVGGGTWEKHDE